VRITIKTVSTVTPLSLCRLVFSISSSFAVNLLLEAIDAAAPDASMSSIPNGSGPELEKFPDAPPSIEVTAPEEPPHAGLRSLNHCMYSPSLGRYIHILSSHGLSNRIVHHDKSD
jgi:hypothetical protein